MNVSSVVELTRTHDIGEAHMIRGLLESHGLFCVLQNDLLVRNLWYLNQAVGGVKILVATSEYTDAKAVLDSLQKESHRTATSKAFLPETGSGKLRLLFSALITLFSGIPTPLKKRNND